MRIVILVAVFLLCASPIFSQDSGLSLGIVNGRATELPKPVLNKRERHFCAGGKVKVAILIGADGRVKTAKATTGNKLLWRSAVVAAKRARFSQFNDLPPIKMRGYLVYNFIPPENCATSPNEPREKR